MDRAMRRVIRRRIKVRLRREFDAYIVRTQSCWRGESQEYLWRKYQRNDGKTYRPFYRSTRRNVCGWYPFSHRCRCSYCSDGRQYPSQRAESHTAYEYRLWLNDDIE